MPTALPVQKKIETGLLRVIISLAVIRSPQSVLPAEADEMRKQSRVPTHPGVVLSTFLIGRPYSEVSTMLGISIFDVQALYAGTRDVTPELSERLDRGLKTPPGLWLKLQKEWDAFENSLVS